MMYQSHCQLIDKWINTYANENVTVLFSLLKEVNEKQHREKWRVDYIKINQEQTNAAQSPL